MWKTHRSLSEPTFSQRNQPLDSAVHLEAMSSASPAGGCGCVTKEQMVVGVRSPLEDRRLAEDLPSSLPSAWDVTPAKAAHQVQSWKPRRGKPS